MQMVGHRGGGGSASISRAGRCLHGKAQGSLNISERFVDGSLELLARYGNVCQEEEKGEAQQSGMEGGVQNRGRDTH